LTENPLVSVIDDSDLVGWAVAGVIGSAGFRVLVFPSAEKFILSGQMACTACLVINAQLKGMSGLQLQSHLAAAGRHIPIVFTIAPVDDKARALAFELGAVNVLDKRSGDKALLKEVCSILKTKNQGGTNGSPSSKSSL
jgi:FixJ family two-component response regulator